MVILSAIASKDYGSLFMNELLSLKDRLVKEYQKAMKLGIHDKVLYEKIMEINNRIMRFNQWGCGNEGVLRVNDGR